MYIFVSRAFYKFLVHLNFQLRPVKRQTDQLHFFTDSLVSLRAILFHKRAINTQPDPSDF